MKVDTGAKTSSLHVDNIEKHMEQRYVIQTTMSLGAESWPIEIALTDRADMNYLMLLGREAMGKRLLIDPSQVFMASLKGK